MDTPLDALRRAIDLAGGQNELARRLGRSQPTVWHWLHKLKGRVPAEAAIDIERAVEGEVARHQLRPDLFQAPNTAPEKRGAVAS